MTPAQLIERIYSRYRLLPSTEKAMFGAALLGALKGVCDCPACGGMDHSLKAIEVVALCEMALKEAIKEGGRQ